MRKNKHDWAKGIGGIPGPTPKNKTKVDLSMYSDDDKKMKEAEIQGLAESMLGAYGASFIRLPDGLLGYLARYSPSAIKKFVSKYLAGFPDIAIIGNGKVYFIEIKTVIRKKEKNGGLDGTQVRWWNNYGQEPNVTYGWEEAQAEILKGIEYVNGT